MYQDLVVGEHLVSVPSKYKYWSRNEDGYLFIHNVPLNENNVNILVFGSSPELTSAKNRPIHTLPPCHILGGYRYKILNGRILWCPDWVTQVDNEYVSSEKTVFPFTRFCRRKHITVYDIAMEPLHDNLPFDRLLG